MKIISFKIRGSIAVLIVMLLTSCRQSADELLPYDHYDTFNFSDAAASYEGQFKAIWTAMNCNYALWDYEEKMGLDWDAVYEEYLPKFQELDIKDSIPDDELELLYKDMFRPLHDGHLYLYVLNKETGNRIKINPSYIRNVEDPATRRSDADSPETFVRRYYTTDSIGVNSIIEHEEESSWLLDLYYEYSLFRDNIVCLKFKSFDFTEHFIEKENFLIDNENITNIWTRWFSIIQELHKTKTLKGVIIDLRHNGGGSANEYQYALGALQTIGDEQVFQCGYNRFKTGVGRLDYSPLTYDKLPNYPFDHANITEEPIVILANYRTGSLAEITCLVSKKMDNVKVIGTRTWGALSSITPSIYSRYYSGSVGDKDKGPFYIYMPSSVFFTDDYEILEGVGVTPDIEVELDTQLYYDTGRDTQLERALEYIRIGK